MTSKPETRSCNLHWNVIYISKLNAHWKFIDFILYCTNDNQKSYDLRYLSLTLLYPFAEFQLLMMIISLLKRASVSPGFTLSVLDVLLYYTVSPLWNCTDFERCSFLLETKCSIKLTKKACEENYSKHDCAMHIHSKTCPWLKELFQKLRSN